MGMGAPNRLPRIDAALILETVGLEIFRDKFGMRECRIYGIGPMRRKLGPVPPLPIHFVPPLAVEAHEMTLEEAMEIARDEARSMLAGLCRMCPYRTCAMKTWDGITG